MSQRSHFHRWRLQGAAEIVLKLRTYACESIQVLFDLLLFNLWLILHCKSLSYLFTPLCVWAHCCSGVWHLSFANRFFAKNLLWSGVVQSGGHHMPRLPFLLMFLLYLIINKPIALDNITRASEHPRSVKELLLFLESLLRKAQLLFLVQFLLRRADRLFCNCRSFLLSLFDRLFDLIQLISIYVVEIGEIHLSHWLSFERPLCRPLIERIEYSLVEINTLVWHVRIFLLFFYCWSKALLRGLSFDLLVEDPQHRLARHHGRRAEEFHLLIQSFWRIADFKWRFLRVTTAHLRLFPVLLCKLASLSQGLQVNGFFLTQPLALLLSLLDLCAGFCLFFLRLLSLPLTPLPLKLVLLPRRFHVFAHDGQASQHQVELRLEASIQQLLLAAVRQLICCDVLFVRVEISSKILVTVSAADQVALIDARLLGEGALVLGFLNLCDLRRLYSLIGVIHFFVLQSWVGLFL